MKSTAAKPPTPPPAAAAAAAKKTEATKRKASNHLSKLVAWKKPRIEKKSQKMIEKKK